MGFSEIISKIIRAYIIFYVIASIIYLIFPLAINDPSFNAMFIQEEQYVIAKPFHHEIYVKNITGLGDKINTNETNYDQNTDIASFSFLPIMRITIIPVQTKTLQNNYSLIINSIPDYLVYRDKHEDLNYFKEIYAIYENVSFTLLDKQENEITEVHYSRFIHSKNANLSTLTSTTVDHIKVNATIIIKYDTINKTLYITHVTSTLMNLPPVVKYQEPFFPSLQAIITKWLPRIHFIISISISFNFLGIIFLIYKINQLKGLEKETLSVLKTAKTKSETTKDELTPYVTGVKESYGTVKNVYESKELLYTDEDKIPQFHTIIIMTFFLILVVWLFSLFLSYTLYNGNISNFDLKIYKALALQDSSPHEFMIEEKTFDQKYYAFILFEIAISSILWGPIAYFMINNVIKLLKFIFNKETYYLVIDKEFSLSLYSSMLLSFVFNVIGVIFVIYSFFYWKSISVSLIIMVFLLLATPSFISTTMNAYYLNDIVENGKRLFSFKFFKNPLFQSLLGLFLFGIVLYNVFITVISVFIASVLFIQGNNTQFFDPILLQFLRNVEMHYFFSSFNKYSILIILSLMNNFFGILAYYVSNKRSPIYYGLQDLKNKVFKASIQVMVFGSFIPIFVGIYLIKINLVWLEPMAPNGNIYELLTNSQPQLFLFINNGFTLLFLVLLLLNALVGYLLGLPRSIRKIFWVPETMEGINDDEEGYFDDDEYYQEEI